MLVRPQMQARRLTSTHWRGLDTGQQQTGSLSGFTALWGPWLAEHSGRDPLAS